MGWFSFGAFFSVPLPCTLYNIFRIFIANVHSHCQSPFPHWICGRTEWSNTPLSLPLAIQNHFFTTDKIFHRHFHHLNLFISKDVVEILFWKVTLSFNPIQIENILFYFKTFFSSFFFPRIIVMSCIETEKMQLFFRIRAFCLGNVHFWNLLQFQCTRYWICNEIYNKFTIFFFFLIFSSLLLSYIFYYFYHIYSLWFIENVTTFFSFIAHKVCNTYLPYFISYGFKFVSWFFYESFICLKCQLTLFSVCFFIFLRTNLNLST